VLLTTICSYRLGSSDLSASHSFTHGHFCHACDTLVALLFNNLVALLFNSLLALLFNTLVALLFNTLVALLFNTLVPTLFRPSF
jgi:hypothetical protein